MNNNARIHQRVTCHQLDLLWEFLNANRDVATSYNRTTQAKAYAKEKWRAISQILNAQGDGAHKDWAAWCKYWVDFKSNIKKRVSAMRASHGRTGGGPSTEKPLTEIELKFLQILGDDFGLGLPGVRVELPPEINDPVFICPVNSFDPSPSILQNLVVETNGINSLQEFIPFVQQPVTNSLTRTPSPLSQPPASHSPLPTRTFAEIHLAPPASPSPRPATSSQHPARISLRPATISPRPTTSTPHPARISPRPATISPRPTTSSPHPVRISPRPAIISPRPTTSSPRRRRRRREPPVTQEASRRTLAHAALMHAEAAVGFTEAVMKMSAAVEKSVDVLMRIESIFRAAYQQ